MNKYLDTLMGVGKKGKEKKPKPQLKRPIIYCQYGLFFSLSVAYNSGQHQNHKRSYKIYNVQVHHGPVKSEYVKYGSIRVLSKLSGRVSNVAKVQNQQSYPPCPYEEPYENNNMAIIMSKTLGQNVHEKKLFN